MPKKALETYDETLLYNREAVKLSGNNDRCPNNDNTKKKKKKNRTDDSLENRIDKFSNLINKKKSTEYL